MPADDPGSKFSVGWVVVIMIERADGSALSMVLGLQRNVGVSASFALASAGSVAGTLS